MIFAWDRDRPRSLRIGSLFRLLCAVALLGASTLAHAHPIHRSLAEADYNRTTKKLEVAVQVFADDFEDALRTHAKQKISLEMTPRADFERFVQSYLEDRFVLKSADGKKAPIEYLGRELREAANELWLFFEMPFATELEGATLHHAVLSEHFRDQINSVALRDGDRKLTLVFLASHKEKRIRFRP